MSLRCAWPWVRGIPRFPATACRERPVGWFGRYVRVGDFLGATHALAAWARIDTGLGPDWHVLVFTLVLARYRSSPSESFHVQHNANSIEQELKTSSQNIGQGRSSVRSGNVAMALQIAMCLTLLVASSLAVRSLLNYERQDLGMQAESLLVFDVSPQNVSTTHKHSVLRMFLDRIQAIPGVRSASLVRSRPGSGWLHSGGITLDGVVPRDSSGSRAEIYFNEVGPDYFQTMGIPMLQGRDIAETDSAHGPLLRWSTRSLPEAFFLTEPWGTASTTTRAPR